MKKKNIWRMAGIFWMINLVVFLLGGHLIKEKLLNSITVAVAGITNLEADIDPDMLTLKDFSDIPGVTQEYVDAYKLFLKTKVQDKKEPAYQQSISNFQKIVDTTENPELKLRSLYFISLSNFLQHKIDEAYRVSLEALKLSRALYKDDKRLSFLDKVINAIKDGGITEVREVNDLVRTHGEGMSPVQKEETACFIEEISLLQERRKD